MKASRFTAAHQSMTFSRRMMLVGGAQFAFGGVLVARLGYLSVAQNQHYKLLSESNRVQLIIVPPRRGWIVDRNGSRSPSTGRISASTSFPNRSSIPPRR